MSDSQSIAQAGGVVSLRAPKDKSLDDLNARHYFHPALGERVVTCLVPETLSQAEDLSMDFYGFQAPHATAPVGRQLRKGLGFPAWALVNDPQRGSLALEVVKEFRSQARLAKSRPGAAKDGFTEIADRLGKSVPHFLPSYFEEAGRVFLEHDNTNYAIQMFGKAREAEKVHALEVDETLRRESFLEFALAGAVSVKALTAYAQELGKERSAEEAYKQYRELCLRRTLGGMPPWAAMLKDLKKLAKASGLDAAAEEREFVQEVLGTASLARAPVEFWVTAKAAVKELCGKSPETARAVLTTRPVFGGNSFKSGQTWLELLDHWGLTVHLTQKDDPLLGPGGAAAWLSSMIGAFAHYSSAPNPDGIFDLIARMAERLKAEGVAVKMTTGWYRTDIDVAEMLMAQGVALEFEGQPYGFSLKTWAAYEGKYRRQDIKHLLDHPKLGRVLLDSLGNDTGNPVFEAAIRGKPGWHEARKRWAEEQIDSLEKGALPVLKTMVERWEGFGVPHLLAAYPRVRERLQKLSVASMLSRTLRGFLPEELSWPALESVIAELDPKSSGELDYDGYFPNLVVHNKVAAVAVGPHGVLGRHDIKMPAGARLQRVWYVGGQFLVTYYHQYEAHSYWSGGRQAKVAGYHNAQSVRNPAAHLDGIGMVFGGRAVQAGDAEVADPHGRFYCDGETCWHLDWGLGEKRLREFDPRSGKQGRLSLPTFFEEYLEPGKSLALDACSLFPFPDGKGVYGFRVRQDESDGSLEGQTNTGLSFRIEVPPERWPPLPVGLVELPGAVRVLMLRHNYVQVYDLEEGIVVSDSITAVGSPAWQLAPVWWHLFAVRSTEDSLTLRKIDAQVAEQMLRGKDKCTWKNEVLKRAVLSTVERAKDLETRLKKFAETAQGAVASEAPILARDLRDVVRLFGLAAGDGHDLRAEATLMKELTAQDTPSAGGLLSKVKGLFSKPQSRPLPEKIPPLNFITHFRGTWLPLAWRSVAPFTPPAQTEATLQLFDAWGKTELGRHREKFRGVILNYPNAEFQSSLLMSEGDNLYFLQRVTYGTPQFIGLEYSARSQFRVPETTTLEWSSALPAGWGTPEFERWEQLVRQHGVRPWDPEAPARLAQLTGLSLPEACLVCAGMPGIGTYETNFLPNEVRETMGLKVAEARAARDSLRAVDSQRIQSLFSRAMPDDPARLWSDPVHVVERLASAWNEVVGRRLSVSGDRLKELNALSASFKPPQMLSWLSSPQTSPYALDGENGFNEQHLRTLVLYTCFLYEYAPAGDPLREAVLALWPMVGQRMLNPKLLFQIGPLYPESEEKGAALRKLAADVGFEVEDHKWSFSVRYRPAKFSPDNDAFQAFQPSLIYTGWPAWRIARDSGFQSMVARFTEKLPEGSYETDPRVSAPHLVPRVESRFGISTEAAVLYLQTLVLAEPTTKNIQLWNSWTSATYKKAAAELEQRELLLQAKRSRAGRSHFLPGGWEDLKAPHLPLESWKQQFYQMPGVGSGFPLQRILSLRPHGESFEAAWSRLESGDAPAYDESKALAPKKGRTK